MITQPGISALTLILSGPSSRANPRVSPVIPDLAAWEDWSQIDRLGTLCKEADEKTSWVRVPVINYLRACPLPEAKERIKELELVDPEAVKRACCQSYENSIRRPWINTYIGLIEQQFNSSNIELHFELKKQQ